MDCLRSLVDAGFQMRVATAKPTVYAKCILEHFELADFFDGIHGSELDGRLTDKTELIAHILQESSDINAGSAMMIGDRSHDMIGAVNNGVVPLGVAWGFGSREELVNAGAIGCVEKPQDLTEEIDKIAAGKSG